MLWPQAILHLDMDAFYVNVHCLDHPKNKGIPLAIGGKPSSRGVVASASYEARKLGIRSAMPMKTAVRLCPTLTIIPANWTRINECSQQVMAALVDFGPIEKMSVDEAYVDVSEQIGFGKPEVIAQAVKTAVSQATSLPCSVGLSTSKLIAKVASDFDKPDGLTVVLPGDEATFLSPQPVRAIWGIGPKTAEKLQSLDITTCGQLAAADVGRLQARLGSYGAELQLRAQGIDPRRVHSERGQAKSISQEWTFSQDVGETAVLEEKLRQMCERVAGSVQKRELLAHTVTVKFRWADFTTFTRQRSVEVGIDSANDIFRLARLIWRDHWPENRPMRLLGVGVSNLQKPETRQLGFDF